MLRPDTYSILYEFFIPREVLPADLQHLADGVKQLGWANPTSPLRRLRDFLSPTAFAQGDPGVSGTFAETRVAPPPPPQHDSMLEIARQDALRNGRINNNVAELERRLIGQTISTGACADPEIVSARDFVRRAREVAEAEQRFRNMTDAQRAASAEYQQVAARRAAIDSELRQFARNLGRSPGPFSAPSGSSSAPASPGPASPSPSGSGAPRVSSAPRVAPRPTSGGAVSAALTAARLAQVEADSRRWKARIAALRACAKNPTSPLARQAMTEDPNYQAATLGQIEAAEVEEAFITNARRATATFNGMASAALRLTGGLGIGVLDAIEESVLKQSMEETLASIEKCITLCDLAQTMTATFTFSKTDAQSGCAATECEQSDHVTNFTGTATLKLNNQEGYEGRGVGQYRDTFTTKRTLSRGPCGTESWTNVTAGESPLSVKAYFSTDNTATGGLQTGRRKRTVVEIVVNGEGLSYSSQGKDCSRSWNETHANGSISFDCHFYDVDLKATGTYSVRKDREEQGGLCTLEVSPQRP